LNAGGDAAAARGRFRPSFQRDVKPPGTAARWRRTGPATA